MPTGHRLRLVARLGVLVRNPAVGELQARGEPMCYVNVQYT